MQIKRVVDFPGLGQIVPPLTSRVLAFTASERAVLKRAQDIADQARVMLRARYGEAELDSTDIDMRLAEIEHSCRELLDGGTSLSELEE